MGFSKVAVIGAGAMGAGIARFLAASGMEVVLSDVSSEFVDKGIARIDAGFAGEVKKGRMTPEAKDTVMGRIAGALGPEAASGADLVIEAVVEDEKIKSGLFAALDRACRPDTVFATNTSTLSVTALAARSGRPARFLGLHFFNPVHVMRLVEVIPGLETPREVVDAVVAAMKAAGKTPIVVQDCPGFLVNRILLPYIGEALLCAEEGISPEIIDAEAKKAGFPMGPLELSDMVGWDVSLHTLPVLHAAYGDRFPFPELVRKLNAAGRLGMKTGKGIYADGRIDDEFRGMVAARSGNGAFAVDRIILRSVNEAVYCLQESVAPAADIDRAMVMGTGFPNQAGIGGPLHWADRKGLDRVLATLEELTTRDERFRPHHLLKTYVAAGRLGAASGKGFFEYR